MSQASEEYFKESLPINSKSQKGLGAVTLLCQRLWVSGYPTHCK